MDFYEKRDTFPDLENEKKIYGSPSVIQNFYRGKKVFITGGNGFVGSLVVEKLLRSCPDIEMIYILMRDKKGKTPKERMEALLDNEIFHHVKRSGMDYMSKVSCVIGDCELPKCGMSEESIEMIQNEVDIVFHIAACLSMDAHITKAYVMNVAATKDLLEIATKMKKLKGFIYCSTAYSQAYYNYIEERFYVPGLKHNQLKQLLDSLSECEAAAISPKLVGHWNNTYAYTKAIAEDLVKEYTDKIPVVVARPSIIIGCDREPLKAWINNIYGATGVCAATYTGLIHVWCCDESKLADVIPADYCANALVAIPWDLVCNRTSDLNNDKRVYNITCDPRSPITWKLFNDLAVLNCFRDKISTKLAITDYFFKTQKRIWLFYIEFLLLHVLKGILFDTAARILRQKPRLVNGYIRIFQFNSKIIPYGLSEWVYERTNYNRMSEAMTQQDKDIFYVDLSKVDWYEYHRATMRGIRLYILKDTFESVEYAKKRFWRMNFIRRAITAIICFFIFKYFLNLFFPFLSTIQICSVFAFIGPLFL